MDSDSILLWQYSTEDESELLRKHWELHKEHTNWLLIMPKSVKLSEKKLSNIKRLPLNWLIWQPMSQLQECFVTRLRSKKTKEKIFQFRVQWQNCMPLQQLWKLPPKQFKFTEETDM